MEGSHQGRPSEEVLYDQSDLSEPEEIPYARSGLLERVPLCQTGLQEQVAFEEAPHVGSDLLKRALLCLTDLSGSARLAYMLAVEEPLSHSDLPPQVEKVRPVCFDLLEPEYLCLTDLLSDPSFVFS